MAQTAEDRIAHAFECIPEVESVYLFSRGARELAVFTVVNEESDYVLENIYTQELQLARSFPLFHLDFNTITRRNRPMIDFVGSNTPAWQRNPTSGKAVPA
jgi:hypothetical protein